MQAPYLSGGLIHHLLFARQVRRAGRMAVLLGPSSGLRSGNACRRGVAAQAAAPASEPADVDVRALGAGLADVVAVDLAVALAVEPPLVDRLRIEWGVAVVAVGADDAVVVVAVALGRGDVCVVLGLRRHALATDRRLVLRLHRFALLAQVAPPCAM